MNGGDAFSNDVLVAAHDAVDSISAKARQRLADGAYYIRLPAWQARRLIEAVDAQQAQMDREDPR